MRRLIVTGITGHLGRQLATQLVAAGAEVHGLTRRSPVPTARWEHSVRYHEIDGSTERIVSIFNSVRPHAVFHTAAQAGRTHQVGDVKPFFSANILFGTQLLEAMRSSNCGRIVTAGSYLQHYGSETYRAFNLYAATKQAFETLLEYYTDAFGIRGIRLTLADIYSEHDKRPKLMTDIANSWAAGESLTLRSEEAWVDLIHVEDAAAAFIHADTLLEEISTASGTLHRYAVTSGRTISATEIVSLFERLGGGRCGINRGKAPCASRGEEFVRGAALPGWSPKITLEEGVRRIVTQRHPVC